MRDLVLSVVLAGTLPVHAQGMLDGAVTPLKTSRALAKPDRFGQFEENYALYHQIKNVGWTGQDEPAVRGHFSLKYSAFEFKTSEVFLSYTGEFDFYFTRPSGPVISRLTNPAIHWRICGGSCNAKKPDALLDIGLEHRSNGQAVEVTLPLDAERAHQRYNVRDYRYFDQISRGSNYFSFTNHAPNAFGGNDLYLRTRLKLYFDRDSDVTWGPLARQGLSISSYDRLNLLVRRGLGSWGAIEAEWKIGDKGLGTDSLTLGWIVKLSFDKENNHVIPVYLRAHFGPFNTLSNYTQRQNSIGFGLRFDR